MNKPNIASPVQNDRFIEYTNINNLNIQENSVSNIQVDNIERDYDLMISHREFESSNRPFENEIDDQYDDQHVVLNLNDKSDENNNDTEDNIEPCDDDMYHFPLDNISSDFTSVKEQKLLLKLINFVYDAKLNKATTRSLLSLLQTATLNSSEDIPRTTNDLWNKLGVKFIYKCYYFCSTCFIELKNFHDCCSNSKCNSKQKPSELCVFSITDELKRIVQSNYDVIQYYNLPENHIMADIVNGEHYRKCNNGQRRLTLMISTDGKPLVKSKRTKTSVWPVISYLVEIPPPIREYLNNTLLLGLWHSAVTPPCHLLLNKIVHNIKCLFMSGINIYLQNEMIHFSVHIQLITGDLPARAKCNKLVSFNGFHACTKCILRGERCELPCNKHTLYRFIDFIRIPQPKRTQEHINLCAQQINSTNENVFGVIGVSPLSCILSIPDQSTFDYFHLVLEIHLRYLLSVWYDIIKQNTTALNFIDKCLDEISYPHSFNRRPRDFANYKKWKASELRCFMIYASLPILVKLCLNMQHCFPEVYISHFLSLYIYIRVLRHFNDRDEIKAMPQFIHSYLSYFSTIYDPCKELYSTHALIHLWQQVELHGGLAYHSLFASESFLQIFNKISHGSVVLGEQISFWWCVFSQLRSKEIHYTSNLLTEQKLIEDCFLDFNVIKMYSQEFDLLFYQKFGEFPDLSLKCYSRYQFGLITYHSLSYSRRQNSNSYNICIKDKNDPNKLILYFGQILFFFHMHSTPFFLFRRYLNSKNKFSSLLNPIEDIPNWRMYIDRYYEIVRHSTSELVIFPCSFIVSKCIFFQLDDTFTICTQIELELEHD
ncbi:unnamed protein product [Adineta steineri]|uniref:Uncharacterized protein n=1 Tax=Adineta steineri TaxID=433720 RepID=A0A815T5J0_9BILA|nr:unnamed protein product [Adineta steineri]CAF1503292.1 unnamed protein product [Adineta steineri]CAF3516362.1 unnamed protein product [Adineta steineri]CAF4111503.1 unnamed protein product [Adineta steineri]